MFCCHHWLSCVILLKHFTLVAPQFKEIKFCMVTHPFIDCEGCFILTLIYLSPLFSYSATEKLPSLLGSIIKGRQSVKGNQTLLVTAASSLLLLCLASQPCLWVHTSLWCMDQSYNVWHKIVILLTSCKVSTSHHQPSLILPRLSIIPCSTKNVSLWPQQMNRLFQHQDVF